MENALSLETVIFGGCIHIQNAMPTTSGMRLGIPTRHTRERFKPWSVGIQLCRCAFDCSDFQGSNLANVDEARPEMKLHP